MKKLIKNILLLALSISFPTAAFAYDFEAPNADGTTIYYRIASATSATVAVTYRDTSYNSYAGSVDIPQHVSYDNVDYTVTSIGANAFRACRDLVSVKIPSTVMVVGSDKYNVSTYTFHGCTSLQNLIIEPADQPIVFGIDYYVAQTSSKNVPMFGQCQLQNITQGRDINYACYGGYEKYYSPFAGQTSQLNVEIGAGVARVHDYAFYGCKNLLSVDFTGASNLATIGRYAFYDCENLAEISIPASVNTIGSESTMASNCVFHGCKALTKVEIADGENPIVCGLDFYGGSGSTSTRGTFADNPLTQVYIGREIVYPGSQSDYAEYCSPFGHNHSVVEVEFGNSTMDIPNDLFNMCTNLTTVKIADGVHFIGDRAFAECESLQRLRLGCNVSSIGNYAFFGCINLSEIFAHSPSSPECAEGVFDGVFHNKCRVCIPQGSREEYENTSGWNAFPEFIEYNFSGDVDGDGRCNSADLGLMINMIVGMTPADSIADVNGDGKVNSNDIAVLINIINGLFF